MPGLFRNVIGPAIKRGAQGAWGGARSGGSRGYGYLRSNIGFGFSALKGDPKTVLGFGNLQAMGRQIQAMRPGRLQRAGMRGNPWGYQPGNVGPLGREVGGGLRRWGTAADLTGQGKLRALAIGSRAAAPGAAVMGGVAGLDFLNPWGLGWGD